MYFTNQRKSCIVVLAVVVLLLFLCSFYLLASAEELSFPDNKNRIACALTHNVAVRIDGTVVACGDNYSGQCNVEQWTDIIAVCATGSRTIGLKADGTIVSTDPERHSQFKDWDNVVAVFSGFSGDVLGLKEDGTLYIADTDDEIEAVVEGWTSIQSVAVGYGHIVGLKTDGTVVATGRNDEGQCDVSDWTDIVAISAGYGNTVGLKSNGEAIAVGNNFGDKSEVQEWKNLVAIACGHTYTMGLKKDGTVYHTGSDMFNASGVAYWEDIIAFSGGEEDALGVTRHGTVVATGRGFWGQNDVSSWTDVMVATPKRTSYALTVYPSDAAYWYDVGEQLVQTDPARAMLAYGKAGYYQDAHQKAQALQTQFRKILFVDSYDNTVSISPQGELLLANPYDMMDKSGYDLSQFDDLVDFDSYVDQCVGVKRDGSVVWSGKRIDTDMAAILSSWTDIVDVEIAYDSILAQKADNLIVETYNPGPGYERFSNWTKDRIHVFDSMSEAARKEGAFTYQKMGDLYYSDYDNTYQKITNYLRFEDVIKVVNGFRVLGLRENGTIAALACCPLPECTIVQLKNVVDIVLGAGHVVVLFSDGTVYADGNNEYGQCNVQNWQDVVAISSGQWYTVGLKADGSVYVTGEITADNNYNTYLQEINSWNLSECLLQTAQPR